MAKGSILTKDFLKPILATARKNLEADGRLYPVLFLHWGDGKLAAGLVQLPATSEEKRAYFTSLGLSLGQQGKKIHEAVFVAESWFVMAQKPASLDISPSQHPERREAIIIVGRDAAATRYSLLVQPFGRDGEGRPVWHELAVATCNAPMDKGYRPGGLLDYLFEASREEVRSHAPGETPDR